jgi:UTP--glucose-1-phosphate uridylyltransferase
MRSCTEEQPTPDVPSSNPFNAKTPKKLPSAEREFGPNDDSYRSIFGMAFDPTKLAAELAALDPALVTTMKARGFDQEHFIEQARSLTEGDTKTRRTLRNRVKGQVRVPSASDLPPSPTGAEAERLTTIGIAAMKRGALAFCVMAGGMATRMGGVVKALVPIVGDKTFLDVRLAENSHFSSIAGRPIPLWLMTSEATDHKLRDALSHAHAPDHVRTFTQNISLRLSLDGTLFRDAAGQPSTFAPGHGDLPDSLRRSGLLEDFVRSGGEVVWITNVDNLGATIDPSILGMFLESNKDVMVEVCPKVAGDKGGIPAWAEGKLQVLEEFRLPEGFDATAVRVFNTNTFLVRAKALLEARYASTYFEVEKTVDGRPAIQFERLLQELTANLDSGYVSIPREGTASRFEPIKDNDELERRRAAIAAIARSRGILPGS